MGGVPVLDTTLGDWSQKDSTRMVYRKDHNDHIHITLDPTKLFKPAEQ